MKHIILIFVLAVALTSCAIAIDYSQASTMQLCDNVLNYRENPIYGFNRADAMQRVQDAHLNELSRRGEDCSSFLHLRR